MKRILVCTDGSIFAQNSYQKEQARLGGFEPVCCLVEGHAEQVIAKYAAEKNIDLLLMGAYGHNRIRHLVIGSTTTQILRSSHIPVLLFR